MIGVDGDGGGGGGRAGYDVSEGGDHDGEFILGRKTVVLRRRHRWRCERVLSHGSLSDLCSLERVVHVSVSSELLLLLVLLAVATNFFFLVKLIFGVGCEGKSEGVYICW